MPEVVIDASALVELLLQGQLGAAVSRTLIDQSLHSPASVDAEVLAALNHLHRAGDLSKTRVDAMVEALARAPIERHPLTDLLDGAWAMRNKLRIPDALCVELARSLELRLVTTDIRLRGIDVVDVVDVG
ncbi:MAG: type II toxin-antitoxin system VapC family toxin [Acidimicrobiales bacterium]|jgi:predicted nucleic acid-binding protein